MHTFKLKMLVHSRLLGNDAWRSCFLDKAETTTPQPTAQASPVAPPIGVPTPASAGILKPQPSDLRGKWCIMWHIIEFTTLTFTH